MGATINTTAENYRETGPNVGVLPDGPATTALKKGMLLRFKKEMPQAIEVLEKANRLFQGQKNMLGLAYARIELAWLYGAANDRVQSEKMFREAEELIEAQAMLGGIHEVRARLVHYKGLLLYQKGDYGQAVKLFKQALTYADPQGLETAKIYDSLGVHYERTGDFHRAVRFLRIALRIKTYVEDPIHEEAITCQILGRLYLLYEEYELAQQHLQRSLDISAQLKDEKRKASIKAELIRLLLHCGKEKEARVLIQETRAECQHRHLRIQHALTCFYEAYIEYSHQRFDVAMELLEKSVLAPFQRFRYNKGLAMAKRLQAWVHFGLEPKNTSEPVSYISEAMELFRRENMIDEVAKTHFELGKFYQAAHNPKLALASYLDALRISEENGLFYLTPYIEDEIFRSNEERWQEIVDKRTRHERIFEKQHSLLEALSQLVDRPDTVTGGDKDSLQKQFAENGHSQSIPFLLSLLKVGEAMAAERDLDKLLGIVKLEVERALDADRCTVFLYDEDTNELWSRVASGIDHMEEIRIPASQGIAGYVVKTGEILNVEDAYQDPRFSPEVDKQTGYKTNTMLCIPMKNRKGNIIGVFQVLNKANAVFSRSDEELLIAIASSAGVALENAQLYQELKVTFESFMTALSSTIDKRDPITAGHSQRVTEYALLIGEKMLLSEDEMEELKYASLLHDIGKIGVKEEILVKEGRLTEKEYLHIQEHVFFTYEILKTIHFEKHLTNVPEIAASHHEKMDGSGYFRGLKGDDIHLGGRILAVADVFDAITSRRQYRSRMPFDRVMRILTDEADRHFDANVIEAFLEVDLKDLGRVLCMDSKLPVSEADVQQTLEQIPDEVSIADYLEILNETKPNRAQTQIHQVFNNLYNFSDISDLD